MSEDQRIIDAEEYIRPFLLKDDTARKIIINLLDVIDKKDREIADLDMDLTAMESDTELEDLKETIGQLIEDFEDGDIDFDEFIKKLKWEVM